MKRFRFHPEALQEADQASFFYSTKQAGLDLRFLDALEDAISRIRRNRCGNAACRGFRMP